jgi:hypothetical protein
MQVIVPGEATVEGVPWEFDHCRGYQRSSAAKTQAIAVR